MSETLTELLNERIPKQRIIWFLLSVSILFYVALTYLVVAQNKFDAKAVDESTKLVFQVIAISTGIAAIALRRFLLSDQRIRANLEREVDPRVLASDPRTGQVDETRLKKIERLNPFEMKLLSIASSYFTGVLSSLALNEAVVVCGFILSILENRFETIIPFAMVGLLLNAMAFPRLNQFIEKIMDKRNSGQAGFINIDTPCGQVEHAGRLVSVEPRTLFKKEEARAGRDCVGWDRCVAFGLVGTIIAVVAGPLLYWTSQPVPFEKLQTVRGEVSRVDIVQPPEGGRYVEIRLKGLDAEILRVHEVNFLSLGADRFHRLSPGDPIVAWLASGWLHGSRNSVWQLDRGDERILAYSDMAEAMAASGAWARLFLTWGLLAVSLALLIVGAIGKRLVRRNRDVTE